MSCQLIDISGIGLKNSQFDNLLQVRVKISRGLKRELVYLKNHLAALLTPNSRTKQESIKQISISSGDTVRVRSKTEIKNMLDERDKYKGCRFIDEMYEHCGKTYKVLKVIDYFFDEARQELCKCRDTVILDGVVCSGRQRLYKVDCDRNCFYFWHTAWLERDDSVY